MWLKHSHKSVKRKLYMETGENHWLLNTAGLSYYVHVTLVGLEWPLKFLYFLHSVTWSLWLSQPSNKVWRVLFFLFKTSDLPKKHWASSWWGWVKNPTHTSSMILFSKYYSIAYFNQQLFFWKVNALFLHHTHLRTFLTVKSWKN